MNLKALGAVMIVAGIALFAIASAMLVKRGIVCTEEKRIIDIYEGRPAIKCWDARFKSNITLTVVPSAQAVVYVTNASEAQLAVPKPRNVILGPIELAPGSTRVIELSNYLGTYCLVITSDNRSYVYVGERVCRVELTEEYNSAVSVTGTLLVMIGIASLLKGILKGAEGATDRMEIGDEGYCVTRSLTKHRCLLSVKYEGDDLMSSIVEVLTSKLGYKVWKRISGNLVTLRRRGRSLIPKKFNDKPRILIVSIDYGIDKATVTLDYEVGAWVASGPIDLSGIADEVRRLMDSLKSK